MGGLLEGGGGGGGGKAWERRGESMGLGGPR